LQIHPLEDIFDDGLRFAGIEDAEILIVFHAELIDILL
jgi:hypothetical protein